MKELYLIIIEKFAVVFEARVVKTGTGALNVTFTLLSGPPLPIPEILALQAVKKMEPSKSTIGAISREVQRAFGKKLKIEVYRIDAGRAAEKPIRPGISRSKKKGAAPGVLKKFSAGIGFAPPALSPVPGVASAPSLSDDVRTGAEVASEPMNSFAPKKETVKPKFVEYEILYGTNRKKNPGSKTTEDFYLNERHEKDVEVGVCKVNIPLERKVGEMPRPGWFRDLVFGESQEKHFMLLSVTPCAEEKFLSFLKGQLNRSTKADALLFIHGYNNTFHDAMLRTAQLGYDLNFKGAVIGFSWPSKGKVKSYIADERIANLSAGELKTFLQFILSKGGIKTLHIVAHSMGNLVLSHALLALKKENRFPLPEIKQIILAAPDIDQETFRELIYPEIYCKEKPPRFTIYASSNDKALMASEYLHEHPRIGFGGDDLLVVDGFESIDASNVDTDFLGHGYFSSTSTLIQDIYAVLQGHDPSERVFLDPFTKTIGQNELPYWVLRKI